VQLPRKWLMPEKMRLVHETKDLLATTRVY
jgi:hypothetical protein